MSASASNSQSQTNNTSTQQSTQGASGGESPTVTAQGNVTVQNAGGAVSLQALKGMQDVVNEAIQAQSHLGSSEIGLLGDTLAKQAEAASAQSDQSGSLLSSILANNQQLAQNVQTGGATAAIKQSNNESDT